MTELRPREPHRPLIWPDMIWEIQAVVAAQSQPVYIVGGAVRAALLHRPVTDIDLAVAADAIALARRIANTLKGDFFVLDRERDVGRALIDTPAGRFSVDVARFRGQDLFADLVDRDFTLNAMAVHLNGDTALLIDPLGGEQDCREKVLRRCHPRSLADDPIRGLRAVRQSVQLGLHIEPHTLDDIRAQVPAIHQVSAERIRDEFIKLLALDKARAALRVAETVGLLEAILPEIPSLRTLTAKGSDYSDGFQETLAVVEKMAQLLAAVRPTRTDHTGATFGLGMLVIQLDVYRKQLQEHIAQSWPNERPHAALLSLAALLHQIEPEQVSIRASALRLSNAERDRLVAIVRHWPRPLEMDSPTVLDIHRFWRQTGEAGVDVCLLVAARYLGVAGSDLDQDNWLSVVERLLLLLQAYFERYQELVEPPVLLDGNALMQALGLNSGPMIGDMLDQIREAQVTGQVRSVEQALALARRLVQKRDHE